MLLMVTIFVLLNQFVLSVAVQILLLSVLVKLSYVKLLICILKNVTCDLDYLNCSLVGSGKGSFFRIFLSGIFFTGLGVGVLTK